MRVLALSCPHEPCSRDGFLAFCKKIYKKWRCNKTVILGDLVDWHGISFHARHPESPGVSDEYDLAFKGVQKWYKAFPNAIVCAGNHDERIIRLAESVDIPAKFLRDYKDIWQTPKWEWCYEKVIDDVYYFHGVGYGGLHPAFNAARQMSMSVCMGHIHSTAGIKWLVNPQKRWFGMDVGCGVDDKKYAFAYGKHMKRKSVISCGVVVDGMPYHEMCPLEQYQK